MQTNVIEACRRHRVKRMIFFGSSCAYPKQAKVPIREDQILAGPIEPTNEPYAVAKIAGIRLCQAYNQQYGTDFVTVIPANLYGPQDHFDDSGHVTAGLIRKFHAARLAGAAAVTLWGTGRPKRDFLFVDDLAQACLLLMRRRLRHDIFNVGSGQETSIAELAALVRSAMAAQAGILLAERLQSWTDAALADDLAAYEDVDPRLAVGMRDRLLRWLRSGEEP